MTRRWKIENIWACSLCKSGNRGRSQTCRLCGTKRGKDADEPTAESSTPSTVAVDKSSEMESIGPRSQARPTLTLHTTSTPAAGQPVVDVMKRPNWSAIGIIVSAIVLLIFLLLYFHYRKRAVKVGVVSNWSGQMDTSYGMARSRHKP